MTTSDSFYALAAQAAEMDGLARAADLLATDLRNDGDLDQKDALTGVARSLATLVRQHTEALDKLAVASRGAKWEAPHHPAHGDAVTIHSLCETALQPGLRVKAEASRFENEKFRAFQVQQARQGGRVSRVQIVAHHDPEPPPTCQQLAEPGLEQGHAAVHGKGNRKVDRVRGVQPFGEQRQERIAAAGCQACAKGFPEVEMAVIGCGNETSLAATKCGADLGLTCPGNHRPDGTKADHAPTIKLDHSGGADHPRAPLLHMKMSPRILSSFRLLVCLRSGGLA